MKTLREYIDQLDEISRRDFLKGAGAAAGLGALGAGGMMYKKNVYDPKNPKVLTPSESNALATAAYCLAIYTIPEIKKIPDYDPTIASHIKAQMMEFANKHPYILPTGAENKEEFSDIIVIGTGEGKPQSTKGFYTDIFNSFATNYESEKDMLKRVVEISPVILRRLKILNGNQEFKESQLEETTDEVERVVQLAKEMR